MTLLINLFTNSIVGYYSFCRTTLKVKFGVVMSVHFQAKKKRKDGPFSFLFLLKVHGWKLVWNLISSNATINIKA